MDQFNFVRLTEQDEWYLSLFDCFDPNEIVGLNKKNRSKVRDLSIGMNVFLKDEAYSEQSTGLNSTFLLYISESLAGYISLCADSVRLGDDQLEDSNLPYATVPAIKVARLAVNRSFQKQGMGRHLINFAVSKAFTVRNEFCGVKLLTVDCYEHRVSYYERIGFVKNVETADSSGLFSLRLDIDEYLENMESD